MLCCMLCCCVLYVLLCVVVCCVCCCVLLCVVCAVVCCCVYINDGRKRGSATYPPLMISTPPQPPFVHVHLPLSQPSTQSPLPNLPPLTSAVHEGSRVASLTGDSLALDPTRRSSGSGLWKRTNGSLLPLRSCARDGEIERGERGVKGEREREGEREEGRESVCV